MLCIVHWNQCSACLVNIENLVDGTVQVTLPPVHPASPDGCINTTSGHNGMDTAWKTQAQHQRSGYWINTLQSISLSVGD